jgi:hypothetical protein
MGQALIQQSLNNRGAPESRHSRTSDHDGKQEAGLELAAAVV